MYWPGALQKKATLSRLEVHGKDIRGVTLYTHMFVLGDHTGRADEREHPHYTATGRTPQEAAAYAVYQKAAGCAHRFTRRAPTLLECPLCSVQQRTALTPGAAAASVRPRGERKLLGFLRLFRPA